MRFLKGFFTRLGNQYTTKSGYAFMPHPFINPVSVKPSPVNESETDKAEPFTIAKDDEAAKNAI